MCSTRNSRSRHHARGGALLMVLWLSAALSAIAFTVATTVRTETGRVTTSVEALKAQYLASAAIERALLYMDWGPLYRNPDGTSRYFNPGTTRLEFDFPTGHASVDIIPESSKMNVNSAEPEDLSRLFTILGIDPARATEMALAIVDWRTPQMPGAVTLFDQFYASRNPSFRARHASFEEIEELLLVKDMTPDLFYGSYDRASDGRLTPRTALRDCLTVYGTLVRLDANTADPALLAAIGLTQESISALVRTRKARPFRNMQELQAMGAGMPGFDRLSVGGGTLFTLRATARPRLQNGKLSDLRRSVAMTLKFLDPAKYGERYHVLRWYDNVWVDHS